MSAKKSETQYCQHCWPTKRVNHFNIHLEYYIDKLFLSRFNFLSDYNNQKVWQLLIRFIVAIGVGKFEPIVSESNIRNRALIFIQEAAKRNIAIESLSIFGQPSKDWRFIVNGKRYYYEEIPLTYQDFMRSDLDDKISVKKILKINNLPVAEGGVFSNKTKAVSYGTELGFPLVVKPNKGSLSHHLTCPINNVDELSIAIEIAQQYSPEFIVEKFIKGNLYRVSIIGQQDIFICQKDPANVIGNGINTIAELIEEKNKHVWRGNPDQMNFTLKKIVIDEKALLNLARYNCTLKTILKSDQKVYLHDKAILSCGCDIINIDCESGVHPDNLNLFKNVAKLFNTDLIGLDFICTDLAKSYKVQPCAILELNSLPYLDMHQYPSHGTPEPIAEAVWDHIIKKITKL